MTQLDLSVEAFCYAVLLCVVEEKIQFLYEFKQLEKLLYEKVSLEETIPFKELVFLLSKKYSIKKVVKRDLLELYEMRNLLTGKGTNLIALSKEDLDRLASAIDLIRGLANG